MEIWDLYDVNRNVIGEHIRGNEMPDNGYHLVVHVWVKNSKGQFLIAQRSASRTKNPLMWECQGGSVLKGENSMQGALREVKEEVGVDLDSSKGKIIFSNTRGVINGFKFNDMMDVWLFEYDGEVDLTLATTDEVAQTKWLFPSEIMELSKQGKFVKTLTYFFDKIAKDS